jgi:hypothetical protein
LAGKWLEATLASRELHDATLAGNEHGIFMRWSHDNQFHDI